MMTNELNENKTNETRIAALGDIHMHEHAHEQFHTLFAQIAKSADILILCGDVTNLGLAKEAEILVSEIREVHLKTVAVLGNHDHQSGQEVEIRNILKSAGVILVDEELFVIGDVTIVGTKGFAGGFDKHMLGSFGEAPIKAFVTEAINEALLLENQLREVQTPKCIVALHYSPIRDTLEGESPEILPFLGSSRLAETIDRFPVSAVVHGHAHHGKHRGATPTGIPVYNCSFDVLKKISPEQPFALLRL